MTNKTMELVYSNLEPLRPNANDLAYMFHEGKVTVNGLSLYVSYQYFAGLCSTFECLKFEYPNYTAGATFLENWTSLALALGLTPREASRIQEGRFGGAQIVIEDMEDPLALQLMTRLFPEEQAA